MEKYVNKDTIIKDEIYETLKQIIICPICHNLMIEPIICYHCQNVFCKKCIEKWKAKTINCPCGCENPIFKDVIEKNNYIKHFKFKCIKGCGEEIPFKDIEKHYSSDCLSYTKRIKILTKEQVSEYIRKTNKEIPKITSISIK